MRLNRTRNAFVDAAQLSRAGQCRGIRDSLVMCPPLVISTEQIDDMVAIIRKSLDEVMPKLRAL